MPGRDLWQGDGDCRDRRVPSFDDDRSDDSKPMSQDSYSAGFDFEVNPRTVATVHYVHNNLIRTIEDLGALVERQRGVSHRRTLAKARRYHHADVVFAADAGVPDAEAKAAVRRVGAWHQPPVLRTSGSEAPT